MNSASAASQLGRLTVDWSSPVVRVTLRHAPLNVIDIPMMEELAALLAEIEAQPDIAVVVISGDGKSFLLAWM